MKKTLALLLSSLLFISATQLSYAEAVWIDVRSLVEHKLDGIEGDFHIPHGDILEGVTKIAPDKFTEIRLYCLSGGRSGKAVAALEAAGYTNVSNSGGISDVRAKRGLDK